LAAATGMNVDGFDFKCAGEADRLQSGK